MKKILLLICITSCFYNTYGQCNTTLPVMENFDVDTIGVCWQVEHGSSSQYDWYWKEYSAYYGGYKCLASRSWNSSQGDLYPDNWIYSLPIDLTSISPGQNIELTWRVRGELNTVAHEYYTVYAATGNQISDFESSSVQRSEYADEVGGDGIFVTRDLNISSLAGNTIYIGFRHQNISGSQFILNIDDVSINTAALGMEDFNKENFKHYYNTVSKTLTLKSSNLPISSVQVYNLLGQSTINKKLSKNTENIDLSSLADGIYIAQIEINNSTKSIKFLKH